MMRLDQETCRDLARAQSREWLETNGIGGYASTSVSGMNTRRYHGLLVAATEPPAGRMVLLSKLEETFVYKGRRFELSTNRYPGAVYPEGYKLLKEFRLDPFPTYVYFVDEVEIEKRVFLVDSENTVVIEYEFRGPLDDCSFEVRPLIAFRDFHATTHANGALDPGVRIEAGMASVTPYPGLPSLFFTHGAEHLAPTGEWFYNFEYDIESERGFDDRDDLFNPFVAVFQLQTNPTATIIASTVRHSALDAPRLRQSELDRRSALIAAASPQSTLTRALTTAAGQFIVRRGDLHSVIAGYHWFADWGRDTMIALPGLTLATGRPQLAREILRTFAQHVDRGMLPNRFPDRGGTPEYNTVDATLWMFEAVRAYVDQTGDWDFIDNGIFDVLADIVTWHRRGTRFGIRVDSDGLLHTGEPGVQLTWMDAKVGDYVVTPRMGKPVEIQALWYNAVRVMEWLCAKLRRNCSAEYSALAEQARIRFQQQFWNPQAGCLYDVIDGESRDATLRPNQIFAVSLPHSMLDQEQAMQVVDAIERELLTPRGLRTLPAQDSRYHPQYVGDVRSRDIAYHQGTVWPWLIGSFFNAWLNVHGQTEANVERVRSWLRDFEPHLSESGLGQVSEIFDAAEPHAPRGCIAQAWSVAELLRLSKSVGF